MSQDEMGRLATLIRSEREALLASWRQQVKSLPSARHLDTPTLNDHVPAFIEELAQELWSRSAEGIAEALIEDSAPAHGVQRYQDGFDVEEVVAEYSILRGCVHDLADSNDLRMQGEPFHVVNRVLDEAIALAVAAFAEQRAEHVRQRREEYLAFVAHDLRTPLNAISLTMNFLERGAKEKVDAAAEEPLMWRILRRNVRQLEDLVGNVLRENVNIEEEAGLKLEQRLIDLWPLVETARLDLHPMSREGKTRLVNSIPEDLLVFADAGMIRRVLQNLLHNSIRYTPGGEVVVAASVSADGAWIECSVTDDGAGIPAHRIESVFEKMENDAEDENGGSGLGLGLAIVKAFVEAHGGLVSVTSEPGNGACFRFTLPAHARTSRDK